MSALQIATSVGTVSDDLGADYKARRTALGMSRSALAKEAGVDRGSLAALEEGQAVRDTTAAAIGKTLRELELEMGMDVPSQVEAAQSPEAGFIRFKVEGVYGAKALVVEGPVANMAELEAAVDRIMRRLQQED